MKQFSVTGRISLLALSLISADGGTSAQAQGTSTTRTSESQKQLERMANRGDHERYPPERPRRPPPPRTFDGARFPKPIDQKMRAIAADHYKILKFPLHVNRGLSTPKEQATAMYIKFNMGEYSGTYKLTPTYYKVLQAYNDYREEAEPAIIDEMQKIIASEMKEGRLISDHLDGYAVDLRIYWIADLDILPPIVARHGGQMRVEGRPPHIHIWFPKVPPKRKSGR